MTCSAWACDTKLYLSTTQDDKVINALVNRSLEGRYLTNYRHLFAAAGREEVVKEDGGTGWVFGSCSVWDQDRHKQQHLCIWFCLTQH